MRRGNVQSGYECSTSSSSWMTGLMSLAGGIGIGAGLLYLLDPEAGEKRRRNIVSGARHLGENLSETASDWLTSAGDYAGDTARSASKSTRRRLPPIVGSITYISAAPSAMLEMAHSPTFRRCCAAVSPHTCSCR